MKMFARFGKSEYKRFLAAAVLLLVAVSAMLALCFISEADGVAYAASDAQENIEEDLSDNVDGTIDRLDTDLFEKFLKSLDEDTLSALGIDDLKAVLKSITKGGAHDFFGNFMGALGGVLGNYCLLYTSPSPRDTR